MICRVCNQPIVIIQEPSATNRFNSKMMFKATTRCVAIHAPEGTESVKVGIVYGRELRRNLEDSCRGKMERENAA